MARQKQISRYAWRVRKIRPAAAPIFTLVLFLSIVATCGCSPARYRLNADRETYGIMRSKTLDPRWWVPHDTIDPHPASRFADPYDPDRPPMPPDDPAAHVDMHWPNGMRGYKHWHRQGDAPEIENPAWLADLEFSEDGTLFLTRERAVELALIHSREYQLELEDLYLTCLALTFERFQFDTQWFFSNFTQFFHFGSGGTPTETNSLTTSSTLGLRRSFAAGGQLLADFSNTIVWQFTGTDSVATQSNIAVTLIQPLLRDAGKNIRLESLTQSERNVFYAARDFARFRKQFYFGVVSGNGGYLGLLRQIQNVRNFEANLESLEEDLRAHEALAEAGLISRIQVDQVFQSFQNGRLFLLRAQNELQDAFDAFKIRLGLPTALPVTLDDSLLRPFEFSDPFLTEMDIELDAMLARYRELDAVPPVSDLKRGFDQLRSYEAKTQSLVTQMLEEIKRARVPEPLDATPDQQDAYEYRLETLDEAEMRLGELAKEIATLAQAIEKARSELDESRRNDDWELLQKQIRQQWSFVSELYVIQTRIRAYLVELQLVDMDHDFAISLALENRLDLLNQRALVVDSWRRIQVAANRLKSDLDVTVGANVVTEPGTTNPFDFSAAASSYRAGFRFDGPLNRLFERNAYRAQLIQYQRNRRAFIALEDRVVQEVRRDLRDLATNRVNFEIARQSLIAAARQVEQARDQLLLPGPAADSSSTQDTLIALNSLLQAKNALISIWVDYETTRVQLLVDLEALQPDPSQEPLDVHASEPAARPTSDSATYELLPPPVRVEE